MEAGKAETSRKLRLRLLTARRAEAGLWASADCCQRILMVAGVLVLMGGCWVLCANEDFVLMAQREVSDAAGVLLEVPCSADAAQGTLPPGPPRMVHLEGCVVSGARFSSATPGLSELGRFKENLPAGGLQGAWFRLELEQYSAGYAKWVQVDEAGNLRPVQLFGEGVRIGSYQASEDILRMIPGSAVALEPSKHHAPSSPAADTDVLSSKTMRVHNGWLYSGNATAPNDGDVRLGVFVGSTRRVSVVAAELGGRLELWQPPQTLAREPKLGLVLPGRVPARAMLDLLAHSEVNLWPLRIIGFLIVWLGMSLLLFPNHVVPDFCGACCYCRSSPPAVLTACATAGASWCYLRAPLSSAAAALLLIPLLLGVAGDFQVVAVGVKKHLWNAKEACLDCRRLIRRRVSEWEEDSSHTALPYTTLEAVGGESGGFVRMVRLTALGLGLGLVMAAPVFQSVTLVDVFGDYWDAF